MSHELVGACTDEAFQERIRREGWIKAEMVTAAAFDVLKERRRQVEVEGWTSEHDDTEHDSGDIAGAASCYALAAADSLSPYSQGDGVDLDNPPEWWPWDRKWWKPNRDDPRRDLVKAGALILAEIERLDRLAAAQLTGAEHG
ncbi:MAG: hypothetical protein P4L82_12110 [Ancalomicrobiaceae bacterium]|nr:hypothetical protein [Ancalomicrobiaceae bacterium]